MIRQRNDCGDFRVLTILPLLQTKPLSRCSESSERSTSRKSDITMPWRRAPHRSLDAALLEKSLGWKESAWPHDVQYSTQPACAR